MQLLKILIPLTLLVVALSGFDGCILPTETKTVYVHDTVPDPISELYGQWIRGYDSSGTGVSFHVMVYQVLGQDKTYLTQIIRIRTDSSNFKSQEDYRYNETGTWRYYPETHQVPFVQEKCTIGGLPALCKTRDTDEVVNIIDFKWKMSDGVYSRSVP